MRFRTFNRLYAAAFGYFWLPCPSCGQDFGGHEWGYTNGMPDSINGQGICRDCAKAGKGDKMWFGWDLAKQSSDQDGNK
jgi:hypothetical protein